MAKCSHGAPRIANRILRRMRDFAQVWGTGAIDGDIVRRGLDSLEIDREFLRTYRPEVRVRPRGDVGEAVDTLEDVYEPFLIQIGFLKCTPRGRMTTPQAWAHLGLKWSGEDQPVLL